MENDFKIGDIIWHNATGELRAGIIEKIEGNKLWCYFNTYDELPKPHEVKKSNDTGWLKFITKSYAHLLSPKNINRRIVR